MDKQQSLQDLMNRKLNQDDYMNKYTKSVQQDPPNIQQIRDHYNEAVKVSADHRTLKKIDELIEKISNLDHKLNQVIEVLLDILKKEE